MALKLGDSDKIIAGYRQLGQHFMQVLLSSQFGTYKTVKAHVRQSRHMLDSQGTCKTVKARIFGTCKTVEAK